MLVRSSGGRVGGDNFAVVIRVTRCSDVILGGKQESCWIVAAGGWVDAIQ